MEGRGEECAGLGLAGETVEQKVRCEGLQGRFVEDLKEGRLTSSSCSGSAAAETVEQKLKSKRFPGMSGRDFSVRPTFGEAELQQVQLPVPIQQMPDAQQIRDTLRAHEVQRQAARRIAYDTQQRELAMEHHVLPAQQLPRILEQHNNTVPASGKERQIGSNAGPSTLKAWTDHKRGLSGLAGHLQFSTESSTEATKTQVQQPVQIQQMPSLSEPILQSMEQQTPIRIEHFTHTLHPASAQAQTHPSILTQPGYKMYKYDGLNPPQSQPKTFDEKMAIITAQHEPQDRHVPAFHYPNPWSHVPKPAWSIRAQAVSSIDSQSGYESAACGQPVSKVRQERTRVWKGVWL